jgi:N-acylglucosamine 2-epimerase
MAKLLQFYENHLAQTLLPFWRKAFDKHRGGVYTCFTNAGDRLLSRDKFTWSQGRFIWLLARLADLCQKGLIDDDAAVYREQAEKTVLFLKRHAFLPNDACAFLLSETGEWKEPLPGQGYDTSFYADCFVALGFSEYARIFRDETTLQDALNLYRSIEKRLATGSVRSEPYPIPPGYRAHSFPMIMLHLSEQLHAALVSFNSPDQTVVFAACKRYLNEIMNSFYLSDGRVAEMITDGSGRGSVLARHCNPGHTIECMWFVIKAAEKLAIAEYVTSALAAVKKAYQLGWDETYGGFLRFVDRDGGMPQGTLSQDIYERLILDTWDAKLWWPHSEALYTTLLAYRLSKDPEFLSLYRQTHDYVFSTFPQSDTSIGEWIQIRDRQGKPLEKVVALPVKDPYHIMRNVMLVIELCHEDKALAQYEV